MIGSTSSQSMDVPTPGYTSEQVSPLQSYIDGANAALQAGDTQNALNYINLYYSSQTEIRGYATDALEIINNQGVFGATANQELINAVHKYAGKSGSAARNVRVRRPSLWHFSLAKPTRPRGLHQERRRESPSHTNLSPNTTRVGRCASLVYATITGRVISRHQQFCG